jgi:Ca2+-binding RTX toxin-like protein
VTAVTPPAAGDVKIEKIESADPVPVGNEFSYRLVVSTVTAATAKSVGVSDTLPAGFKLRSVATTRGTCTMSGATVGCALGDLAPGSTVIVTVAGAFVVAGTLTNTAAVTATGDPTSANDRATANTTVTGKTCTVIGTFGDDNPLLGTNKADVICGLAGDDRINGKQGNDTIYGNEDDDRLNGLGGNDLVDGGPGTDTTTHSTALQSMRVNLGLHKATGQGVDTLVSIENVEGSKFADILTGDSAANLLSGGGGADTLNGQAGNDKLLGGGGPDRLKGGGGNDTMSGGPGADSCAQGTGKGPKSSC